MLRFIRDWSQLEGVGGEAMKRYWIVIVAFAAGITPDPQVRADGPAVFGGPPIGGRRTEIRLSAFHDVEQIGERTELPPAPMPLGRSEAPDRLPGGLKAAPVHPRVALQAEPARPLPPMPAARPLPAPANVPLAMDNDIAHLAPAPMQAAGIAPCMDAACPTCGPPFEPYGLEPGFDLLGIGLGGWVDGGFSALGNSPGDRFNGPVTFNDRNLEGQLNQVWLYLERPVDPDACNVDIGGRIDVMYGTDAMFLQASDGLEEHWNQTDRFYQAALPQFYIDGGWDGWTVRAGRFFTPLGYESPAAPDNFFYSHSYEMQYGKPLTHLGALFGKSLGQWSVQAGFHRGNDQFDDTDGHDALNFLGGVGYTGLGGCFMAEYALTATEEGPGVNDYIHSIVARLLILPELEYVLVNNYGQRWDQAGERSAVWYGINQYLTCALTEDLAAGLRLEWFCDLDGTRVRGLRSGNTLPAGASGDFYAITFGLNYTPLDNLRLRPEVRWDFFDPIGESTPLPYDSGQRDRQFLFAIDVLYTF
ncbi:MAG: outer membrane beta-barrel protein [Pirellulales bacterium]|jgi:hypothetical protein|nr:outer membrane beta-barrel protein [Thermoguttaceae bacterium]MDD4789351.1 outer membrane beta-barrel protein [Pirellulales bacterium]MDI9445228.1 outer membrane beta-barrel protein [Planctomycetota bacterium]